MIRLLMADDHPIVRAGLRAVLETEPDFVIIAEATTAEQAIELSAELEIDVVLMDLQFGPGMHGVDAIAAIAASPGAPHVLVLTTYDTDATFSPPSKRAPWATYSKTHRLMIFAQRCALQQREGRRSRLPSHRD